MYIPVIIVHENSSLKFDYDNHKYKISKRVSDTNSQKEPYSYTLSTTQAELSTTLDFE